MLYFSIPPVAKETEAYKNYELPESHSREIVDVNSDAELSSAKLALQPCYGKSGGNSVLIIALQNVSYILPMWNDTRSLPLLMWYSTFEVRFSFSMPRE